MRAAAVMLILLTGCAVGPDYKRPAATATMPATYDGWKIAEPQAHLPRGSWWEMFGDAELNRLEAEAAAANQELKAAVAQFAQARAAADVARSGLFPRLTFNPSVTREGDSANRPENGPPAGSPATYNTFTVPLNFTYEVDLWGRVRRSVESALALQRANAADLESVKLAIQAEVATDYFALRALDSDAALLRSTIEVFRKSLELTRNRRAGGVATDLDVAQAETVLKSAEAELPATLLQRVKLQHALAVLTGRPAGGFTVSERPLALAPPVIPPGLPSQLLERRPDIAGAEQRMASANANIGVAKAAFFPTVQFSGLAGLESVNAGTVFNWSSRLWAVGPQITLPIFDAGRNLGNLRVATSAYEQTVALYRQTVLAAFGEVEDNLAAQELLAAQHAQSTAAFEAARKQLAIATNRYRAGLVTYLEVATAQNSALQLERAVTSLHGQRLETTVALVKALGGGWQAAALVPSTARAAISKH